MYNQNERIPKRKINDVSDSVLIESPSKMRKLDENNNRLVIKINKASGLNETIDSNASEQSHGEDTVISGIDDTQPNLNFSLLNTDDSTDDEGEPLQSQHAIPKWSLPPHRNEIAADQENIEPNIVRDFFGLKVKVVKMVDIFPEVDKKQARRRRSSRDWAEPVRFSVLPEY